MLKTPKKFIRKLENDWSMSSTEANYTFIDDMDEMVRAIFKAIDKLSINYTQSLSVVKHNTIVGVHALLLETLFSILSELRIVLNPLNRSILENYILLSFIIKYGGECAELFITNSEYVYYKTMLKYKQGLSEQEIMNSNKKIIDLEKKFPDVKFGNQYKWANQYMNKSKGANFGLKELAINAGIESAYNMLSNFHHQTHSSSVFAQHMNTVEFNDYDMYIMKAVMAFNYGYEICRLVFEDDEIKDIKTSYDSIMEKYKSIYQK